MNKQYMEAVKNSKKAYLLMVGNMVILLLSLSDKVWGKVSIFEMQLEIKKGFLRLSCDILRNSTEHGNYQLR